MYICPSYDCSFLFGQDSNALGLGQYSSGIFGEESVDEVSGTRWRTHEDVQKDLLNCLGGDFNSTWRMIDPSCLEGPQVLVLEAELAFI